MQKTALPQVTLNRLCFLALLVGYAVEKDAHKIESDVFIGQVCFLIVAWLL